MFYIYLFTNFVFAICGAILDWPFVVRFDVGSGENMVEWGRVGLPTQGISR